MSIHRSASVYFGDIPASNSVMTKEEREEKRKFEDDFVLILLSCQSILHCFAPVKPFIKAFFNKFFPILENNQKAALIKSKIVGTMVVETIPGMFKFKIFLNWICKWQIDLHVSFMQPWNKERTVCLSSACLYFLY